MRPHISVVVPCLDEAASLAACLDALDAQDTSREHFEVILVDGGSTDGSREIAKARGVHVLPDAGRGPGAARNVGVAASSGEIIAFTDADCIPRPDWLTRVAEVLSESPDVDGVAGALRLPRSTLLGRMEDNDARIHYRGFITSNIAYRREAIDAVGGFDESLRCCEDYDLAWRLLDAGRKVIHSDRPVVVHAPPEIAGSLPAYLRKQFWYARHDVPAHMRALARASRDPDARAGSASAALGGLQAISGSAMATSLGAGLLLRRPRLAAMAIGALAAGSARSAIQGVRALGGERADAPKMAAVAAARRVVRGFGTLAGLADLARPGAFNAPATGLAPRAPLVRPMAQRS